MPFQVIRNDITRMHVDAIVTTAGKALRAEGGVNGAIHKAAGIELEAAVQQLGGCAVGQAKITPGFNLPCKYVIHTVSPVWRGTQADEQLLADCYTEVLRLAVANGCESVAFPLIGAGAHGCPKEEALRIATGAVSRFLLKELQDGDLMVYIVVYSSESVLVSNSLYQAINEYIDDHYVEEHTDLRLENVRALRAMAPDCMPVGAIDPAELEKAVGKLDESFAQMLLRLIDARGMTASECYHRANIDRRLFSKIINKEDSRPKKMNVLALAVALRLSLEETQEFLMKAGYTLSHSVKSDVIVEFFITHGIYDVDEINVALFNFKQGMMGSSMD